MKKTKQKSKILFLIQFPPPLHGVSVINEHIYKLNFLNEYIQKEFIELKFSNNLKTLSKLSFYKILKTIIISFRLLIKTIVFKPKFIYFTISPSNNTFYRDLIFVFIIKVLNVKPIYHLHGKGINENILKHPFIKRIYRWVFNNSIIIHLSEGLVKSELIPLNLKNTKIHILQNGIVKHNKIIIRNVENKKVDLLFLSNLFPSKGIFILLEAMQLIKKELPNVSLNIVGDIVNEEIFNKTKRLVNDYGITNNVTIHGQKLGDEKNTFFENSKIFVHPTLNDAFPLVILEALQYGLPVISTFEGAIPEILDEKTGILVEKNKPKELASKIIFLLKNEYKLKKMSKYSRELFNEKFTFGTFDKNINRIFSEIIN